MKNGLIALIALFMSINLVGCSTNTREQNMTAGTVAGALIGGGAGAFVGQGVGKAVAIGVGIVGGALLGGYIGNHMDSSDNAKMNNALNNPTNQSTVWKNEKTGASYSVRPTSSAVAAQGYRTCRQFHTTATIDGKTQEVDGTACRLSNGTWQTINS